MPRIRRRNLPRALFRHLVDRVREREITTAQLEEVFEWLETEPEVSEGKWFKRFPEVTVCGEGKLIKTFLRAGQAAAPGGTIKIVATMIERARYWPTAARGP